MNWLWTLAVLPLAGCKDETPAVQYSPLTPVEEVRAHAVDLGAEPAQVSADAKRVLVVINQNSKDSVDIGQFYVKQRKIPHENVVIVTTSIGDDMPAEEYHSKLETPVREKIKSLKTKPDFIVLTKGVPIRTFEKVQLSVDAFLAVMDKTITPIWDFKNEKMVRDSMNTYFGKNEPFSSQKYGFYLVTRLDGYTAADAKALVTHSLESKPSKGPFLIDIDPDRVRDGYAVMHESLVRTVQMLKAKGFEVEVDETDRFVSGSKPVMGYASWGSNDKHFSISAYKSIRFLPGAISETFVSTSARTFSPVTSGQSVITDLIAGGVTGVKGYVHEPYTVALARTEILFDRYTSGYTLAESFYMASPLLKWKDTVVGDPICRPYPMTKAGSS